MSFFPNRSKISEVTFLLQLTLYSIFFNKQNSIINKVRMNNDMLTEFLHRNIKVGIRVSYGMGWDELSLTVLSHPICPMGCHGMKCSSKLLHENIKFRAISRALICCLIQRYCNKLLEHNKIQVFR